MSDVQAQRLFDGSRLRNARLLFEVIQNLKLLKPILDGIGDVDWSDPGSIGAFLETALDAAVEFAKIWLGEDEGGVSVMAAGDRESMKAFLVRELCEGEPSSDAASVPKASSLGSWMEIAMVILRVILSLREG